MLANNLYLAYTYSLFFLVLLCGGLKTPAILFFILQEKVEDGVRGRMGLGHSNMTRTFLCFQTILLFLHNNFIAYFINNYRHMAQW